MQPLFIFYRRTLYFTLQLSVEAKLRSMQERQKVVMAGHGHRFEDNVLPGSLLAVGVSR